MSSHNSRYSMLIEWSNLDDAYVVSFPEWERAGHLAHTHGATYTEAARKGQELLENIIARAGSDNEIAPPPALFDEHAYATGETAESIARDSQDMLREIKEQPAATPPSSTSIG